MEKLPRQRGSKQAAPSVSQYDTQVVTSVSDSLPGQNLTHGEVAETEWVPAGLATARPFGFSKPMRGAFSHDQGFSVLKMPGLVRQVQLHIVQTNLTHGEVAEAKRVPAGLAAARPVGRRFLARVLATPNPALQRKEV